MIGALFLLSGFSALIYETVWLRMLVRVFGSSAIATSNVLAIFMGGLALGAWLFGRRAKNAASPLRWYAWIEAALAVCACAATAAAARLPAWFAGATPADAIDSPKLIALRSLFSCAVLILPTVLMGASLPLLIERLERDRSRGATALLYGLNTLGAVLGTLFSGFYSLGAWGEKRTVLSAAAVNVTVAVAAFALSRGARAKPAAVSKAKLSAQASAIAWLMLGSGFCALGFEVLWTRLLVLVTGNSIYAFAAMLSVYLTGITAGSLVFKRFSKNADAAAFCMLQAGAALAAALGLEFYRFAGLQASSIKYLYSPLNEAADIFPIFLAAAATVAPATLAYGALFPLSARLGGENGAGVGRIYALNTVGAVLGSLICGFWLVPSLGVRNTFYLLCAGHAALAALSAVSLPGRKPYRLLIATATGAAIAGLAAFRPDPYLQILSNRLAAFERGRIVFHLEGPSSTVTCYSTASENLFLFINGIMTSGKSYLGRMMVHLPLLLQERPKRALVICLGVGNTFRAALDHGMKVDLVELAPEVVAAFKTLWPDAAKYEASDRARIHVNDGRNFLLVTRDRFDAIIVDGTPPIFSAGTVNLYSTDFFAIARERLTDEGVMALWVPLPSFERDFWTIARSFGNVFPHMIAWAETQGQTAGVLLLGSRQPLDIDGKTLQKRMIARGLHRTDPWLARQPHKLPRFIGEGALRAGAARFAAVTDDRPYTEFPLNEFLKKTPIVTEASFLLK